MFFECTYTRPIRSEAKPAHIEKALSLLGIFENNLGKILFPHQTDYNMIIVLIILLANQRYDTIHN